ncbi:hypothetical protein [Vagococcus fluvialis]|uniref:hypothetical protein n=1 Tax=Vagococcus fluvialis TaxID=2738 RepID=UPI0022E6CA08|nr:hypothetical protein [Vagococcus fluvialis]
MALTVKKSSTLNGESIIDGQVVLKLTAEISSDSLGNSYVRRSVLNQELYANNRVECRKDEQDFQSRVYLIEDKFIEEGFTYKNDKEELAK